MATEMLHAGIPLPVVARRLDHQRPSTTLNCYARAVPGGDAAAATTLHAIIANAATDAADAVTPCSRSEPSGQSHPTDPDRTRALPPRHPCAPLGLASLPVAAGLGARVAR